MAENQATESESAGQAPKGKWAASSRRKRERWIAAGLCAACGKTRDNDSLTCDDCLEKMRARTRKQTEKKRAARPPKPPPLTADRAAYRRAWHAKRRAAGVCTTCGGVRDVAGKVRCSACHAKDKADYEREGRARYQRRAKEINGRVAAQRAAWRTAGLCSWCGNIKDNKNGKRCKSCNARNRFYLKRQRLRRLLAGLCPKCGNQRDGGRLACSACLKKGKIEYEKLMATNPDSARLRIWRRRTRLVDNGGTLTVDEWKAIKEMYDSKCLKCGKSEPEIKLTLDHILPVIMGGKTEAANVQPLCESCNKSKGPRHADYRPKAAV